MTDDISTLTPEQATERLNEMTAAYRGAPSEDPAAKLARFTTDREKGQKLLNGDVATRREMDALVREAATDANPARAAMSGNLPEIPTSEQRLMANMATWLREEGISEEAIEQALSNREISQAEHDAAKNWKEQKLSDGDWVKKWLSGDALCKKEMKYASIILTSTIKGKAA
jgi:hypothetical protein